MVACGPPTKLRQVVRIPKTEVVGSSPISIDSLFALADFIRLVMGTFDDDLPSFWCKT